jgi:hypothetical protein
MRVTAAAPEALVSDSNQLAMCLAFGPADGETYVGLNWTDTDGNLYAAASWEARDEWVQAASQPLVRPAWDVDEIIDMVAAGRAQASLVFSMEPVPASPLHLVALGGLDGVQALAAMGLTAVTEPTEE